MIRAWRIVKQKHAKSAFTGEGASLTGGRWNSQGVRIVYASSSKPLAVLETLVHLNPLTLFRYVIFEISFDSELLEKTPKLPRNWKEQPPPPSSRRIGDSWIRAMRSAVLEVPSVVIPTESNFLFNPAHPDYRRLVVGNPEPFAIDQRLLTAP